MKAKLLQPVFIEKSVLMTVFICKKKHNALTVSVFEKRENRVFATENTFLDFQMLKFCRFVRAVHLWLNERAVGGNSERLIAC